MTAAAPPATQILQPAAPILVSRAAADTNTTFAVLITLSTCHLLNDMNQSLVPAIYPILKHSYDLDFGQIGLITLAFQLTASMLQPVVGMVTDRRPQPYSLPVAMGCSLVGLLLLAVAHCYGADPVRRRAGRDGLLGVPSGGIARGAHGQRRPLWLRAVAVPGRRQHRLGDRPAAGGVHRGAARPAQHCLVLGRRLLAILLLSTVSLWYARHPSIAARAEADVRRSPRRPPPSRAAWW